MQASVRRSLARGAGIAVVVTLAIVGGVLLGFDFPFLRVEASLSPKVSLAGTSAHVDGTTTLPDGAVVEYYYGHELEAVNARNDPHYGTVSVRDGQFHFVTDLSDWPAGKVTLNVEFSVAWEVEQPADVRARFGSQGERLDGPQVYVGSPGDPKMLFTSVAFELPSQSGAIK